jgi:hypothetical protein
MDSIMRPGFHLIDWVLQAVLLSWSPGMYSSSQNSISCLELILCFLQCLINAEFNLNTPFHMLMYSSASKQGRQYNGPYHVKVSPQFQEKVAQG